MDMHTKTQMLIFIIGAFGMSLGLGLLTDDELDPRVGAVLLIASMFGSIIASVVMA